MSTAHTVESWTAACAAQLRASLDGTDFDETDFSAIARACADSQRTHGPVETWRDPAESAIEELSYWTDDEGATA